MFERVPLAWRNATSDLKRLRRAATGIGFAAVLILVQLGFLHAFLESALYVMRSLDGELVILSPERYKFAQHETFDRRRLYEAMGVPGVASVAPLYLSSGTAQWRSPLTGEAHIIRVIATDPDNPAFILPNATAPLSVLKAPNTVMADDHARRFLGMTVPDLKTDLAGRGVRVVGTFSMGPDFITDGTLAMSDRNFFTFFNDANTPGLARDTVDYGVVKVKPGYSAAAVAAALKADLPKDVTVLTKAQVVGLEIAYQNKLSPTGPIFSLGTAIGFLVGLLITYQILYTEISDRLHLFATLKAMGYGRRYLLRVIVEQSLFYGVAGFIPALLFSAVAFAGIRVWMLLPMEITGSILATTFGLLLLMCTVAGLIAARRALTVDPAEVF